MRENCYLDETSVISENASIGESTRIWQFSVIMSDVVIGKNCNIGMNVFIEDGVRIGNNVTIKNNVSLYSGVQIEDNCFIGPSCVFTNVINPRSFISRKNEFKTTLVKEGASIGANATIICGNEIGKYSLIGAGSVITRDIEDYECVVGNPCKHLYFVDDTGNRYKKGLV